MSLEIQRLGPADVEAFRAIRLSALRQAPRAFGSIIEQEAASAPAEFAQRLNHGLTHGAFLAGAIVGMAGLRWEERVKTRHKGWLWGVFVEPRARGAGVGARLIETLLAQAPDFIEQTHLVVVSDNRSAIALYERLGFKTYGVEPRALKQPDGGYADEVMMARLRR